MPQTSKKLEEPLLLILAAGACLVALYMANAAITFPVFPLVMGLLFWALGAVLLLRRPLVEDTEKALCTSFGLYLAICLRLVLFEHISPDYTSFLSVWTETMRNMTLREALVTPIGDYNMPYLYLILLASRLKVYDLYVIKLFSVLSDVFLAIAVGRLTALVTKRPAAVLGSFFGALLLPTVWLNSAYWGQCDGIYAMFSLWGLYYGLKKRPVLCLSMFALAFSFKLQAVFLLPMVLFLLVRGDISPKNLPVFPGVFLLVMLPALLAGRSVSDTFSIYLSQTEAYPYMSLNAPSFWVLVPNDYFHDMDPAPVLLAGIGALGLVYLFLRRKLNTAHLLELSLIFSLAIPYLLPKMHERYFYLAEVLSICYTAKYPRRLPVALVIEALGFLVYRNYLFGGNTVLNLEQMALVNGAVLTYLVYKLHCSTTTFEGGNSHDDT